MKPAAEPADTIYFTLQELGAIIALSVLAALSGALVPSWLFPEGRISAFVYNTLALPGPGAGVLVFGSILCFWLLLGLIVVKKPGTAVAMATVLIAIDLLVGSQVILIQTIDVLLIVALIIEVVCLLPAGRIPEKNLLPAGLAGLSLVTVAIALLGKAAQGESDIPLTGIPWFYFVCGILGLCFAFISYRHPSKFLLAAGLANSYYLVHFWLFWGEGFASRFPPVLEMIPVLLLVALLGGVLSGSAAYGIELLAKRFGHDQ